MTERINDEAAFEARTGRTDRVKLTQLDKIEEYILKYSNGIYIPQYDVNRIQQQDFDCLSYTELFKNAVYVIPRHTETAYKLARLCITTYNGDIEQDRQTLKERMQMCDKYSDLKPIDESFRSICFLPGSNIIKQSLTMGTLAKAAYLDEDLMFKMHPLTNEHDKAELERLLKPTRIIPTDVSGFDLMLKAERVYCCSNSELGLYASVLGKTVIDLTKFESFCSLSYSPLYRFLHYPYTPDDLVKVLINPMSGVIFHQQPDLENAVKNLINTIIELQDLNKTYSNENYKKRIKDIQCQPTQIIQSHKDTSNEQTESSRSTASQSHSQTTNESTETTQLGTN